jgi:hypothetical protein
MNKSEILELAKSYKDEIHEVKNNCQNISGKQIQTIKLKESLELLATKWFDQIEPLLRNKIYLDEAIINQYREPFGKILELSDGKPSKRVVLTILETVAKNFHKDIIVEIQKFNTHQSKYSGYQIIITHAKGLELDYLKEALECAQSSKKRAAIILGWCAVIYRLHLYIERDGFDKFNRASVQMSSITTGRYKRFSKKFDIHNLSELQMSVFDNDLLWVLEFLGAIDGNQHDRLMICFTMRNTCAHPGQSQITDENILSFFSDIDTLIFSNPKFSI